MIDSILALTARLPIGQTQNGAASASAGVQAVQGGDFGAMLTQIAADAVGTLKAAEATSMSGLHARASAQQVVESILAAEQTMQTVIAIRDKTVNAYLELTRMQI